MAGNEVRFDVVASDKASNVLDDVATEAEKLERSDPTVTVDADTKAADRDVEGFAKQLDKLSDTDKVIVLGLRAAGVQAELTDLLTDVSQLDASDPTIDVKVGRVAELSSELDDLKSKTKAIADTSIDPDVSTAAMSKLRDLNSELDRAGQSEGPRLAGNQIADLTGPFGAASSAASDFGGVFDGLADIAEKVAGSFGLNAARMATAIGGIGLGVAAVAAVWTIFSENQKKAREEQKKLIEGQEKLNEAVAAGKVSEAADQWIAQYGEFYKVVQKAGVGWDEFITIITTGVIPPDTLATLSENTDELGHLTGASKDARNAIADATDQWDRSNKTLGSSADQAIEVENALTRMKSEQDNAAGSASKMSRTIAESALQTGALAVKMETAADSTRNLDAAYRGLTGQFDDEAAWLNIQDGIAGVEAAMKNAKSATEDQSGALRDARQSQLDLIDSVSRYAQEVLKLPPSQTTEIIAAVNRGDLAEANRLLDEATKQRTAWINVQVSALTGALLGALTKPGGSGGQPVPGGTTINNFGADTRPIPSLTAAGAPARWARLNGR